MNKSVLFRNKIKVFVSSRCGVGFERYDTVRAELKRLIESTNIADVYLFEENGASTLTAQQDYLYALDDSDVCIFLIDNLDDVTPPIMKEISRAKSHPKKSLYLFCDENKKEPTQVQKELIGAVGSKFYIVSKFNDFVQQGYQDLINDITRIYVNYCKKRLTDTEFGDTDSIVNEKVSMISDSLSKKNLKQVDKCKIYLGNILYPLNNEVENTSELDTYLELFLKVIWGEKDIKEFNVGLYLDLLENDMDTPLHQVVKLRWNAIQSYWLNDLGRVTKNLHEALKLSRELELSAWIIQDILIDVRNMEILSGKLENKIIFDTEAQKELNGMTKELFFPVIDRAEKNYYLEINKEYIKNQVKSVYSVKFGNNIKTYAEKLAQIYVTASYYGSLSHILLLKERIKYAAFYLCEEYIDWEFRVLLIKLVMLTEDSKKISEKINHFNNILGKMNAKDSLEIYNFMSVLPIKKEQIKSKLEVFKHLGYYFSNEDYQLISDEILNTIYEWLENENREVFLGDLIITCLQENRYRMDSNIIINISLKILNKKIFRFFDKVILLLESIDLLNVNTENLKALKNALMEIVLKEQLPHNKLVYVLINLSKQISEFTDEINLFVEQNITNKYKEIYFLETTDSSDDSYVMKYIEEIQKNIDTRGKNGSYSFSGYNPYLIVKSILNSNPNLVENDLLTTVIKVCENSLLANNLTYSEKISAIHLIIFIKNNYRDLEFNYMHLEKQLMMKKNDILVGIDEFLQKHSQLTLEFNIIMLRMALDDLEVIDLIDIISVINNENDFEKIEFLKAIKNILHNEFFKYLDQNLQNILVQFVLSLKNHSNMDIRYLAISALLKMLTPLNKKAILTHLSKTMDYENVYIKNIIITNMDNIMKLDNDIAILILKKSLLDNHYLVRKTANLFIQNNSEININ